MTLGYKQQFSDGTPSLFKEKILHAAFEVLNNPYPIIGGTVPPSSMYILNNPQYKDLKPKITSIRNDPHDRWPPSTGTIHHCYGNRTPQRECFMVSPCISVQKIMIFNTTRIDTDEKGKGTVNGTRRLILVDGRAMNTKQMEDIAVNDGFNDLEHFFTWFTGTFSGKIIHFTKLRY